MLRRVLALAAVGLIPAAPLPAAELVTYPTLARGTVAFAPAPFATLGIDWFDTFAPGDGAAPLIDPQLFAFLSGNPAAGETVARLALTEFTDASDPPATLRPDEDLPAPFDF